MADRLLSTNEVAFRLGVSRNSIYRHWQEWGWRGRLVVGRLRFPESDIEKFIKGGQNGR